MGAESVKDTDRTSPAGVHRGALVESARDTGLGDLRICGCPPLTPIRTMRLGAPPTLLI
jgi:hypothetical protein